MAFECLLISRDPQVICPVNRVLDDFSISTVHFFSASRVLTRLNPQCTDLFVVDYEDSSAPELLRQIKESNPSRKKTVVAVSSESRVIPDVDFVLEKPITNESTRSTFRLAYTRMLRDYRRSARYALMIPVTAIAQDKRTITLTVTNIGDGGIGMAGVVGISAGDVLSFSLPLPNAKRTIRIDAKIIWTREYGAAGCEFLRIPPVDLDILHDWLKSKCQIKKPAMDTYRA
jgi:hypothetical protein